MKPKVKIIPNEMAEALEAHAKSPHKTLIIAWAELQKGDWPGIFPTCLPHGEQPSKTTFAAVGNWIIKKVGRYACSKYWNVIHLESMTEKEFDSFWAKTYNKAQSPRLAAGIKHDPANITKEEQEAAEAVAEIAHPDAFDQTESPARTKEPTEEYPTTYPNNLKPDEAQPAKKKKKSKKKKKG